MADDGLRLYGTTDHDMDQTPPDGGMRGEGDATPGGAGGWRHDVTLSGGRRVAVEEVSGLSHAEATGVVMGTRAATSSRGAVHAVPLWPMVVAATLGFAVGQRWRRGRQQAAATRNAAVAETAAEDGAFAHIRDAGAASTRDRAGSWDRVAQGSDGSPPASGLPHDRAESIVSS